MIVILIKRQNPPRNIITNIGKNPRSGLPKSKIKLIEFLEFFLPWVGSKLNLNSPEAAYDGQTPITKNTLAYVFLISVYSELYRRGVSIQQIDTVLDRLVRLFVKYGADFSNYPKEHANSHNDYFLKYNNLSFRSRFRDHRGLLRAAEIDFNLMILPAFLAMVLCLGDLLAIFSQALYYHTPMGAASATFLRREYLKVFTLFFSQRLQIQRIHSGVHALLLVPETRDLILLRHQSYFAMMSFNLMISAPFYIIVDHANNMLATSLASEQSDTLSPFNWSLLGITSVFAVVAYLLQSTTPVMIKS